MRYTIRYTLDAQPHESNETDPTDVSIETNLAYLESIGASSVFLLFEDKSMLAASDYKPTPQG